MLSPCIYTALVVAMVKVLHPASILHRQTERHHSYRFLQEEIEDGRDSWNPVTAVHSYIALLCDVQAPWSTCKTTLRFHALHSITPLQRRTTWRRTQRARAQGRPQLSSFIVVFQCHSASSESILRPVSVLLNARHTERQSRLLLDFTQHCEYVVDALSYHTAPWYFITSRDVMLKNKLLVEWCWSRRGFKAPKSHLSAGLSSAAAH